MPDCNQRRLFSTAICYLLFCLVTNPLSAQQELLFDAPLETITLANNVFPAFEDITTSPQHLSIANPCLGHLEHFTIHSRDEVWLIDAREFVSGGTNLEALKVSQFIDGQLTQRKLVDLTNAHASGDERATLLYIHGNQTDEEYALFRGLQVYRNALTSQPESRAPVRFVVFAWKSELEKVRRYPDYKIKAERSILLGETFAATLNQFSDHNIVVFGYSLGAQVLLSAFDSPSLVCRDCDSTLYQAIFVAPAIDAKFIASHSLKRDQSPSIIERSVVFSNRKDRAIRAAQVIIRRKLPGEASTIPGLAQTGKLQIGQLSEVDVSDEAGRAHRVERYTKCPKLQRVVVDFVNQSAAKRK